MGERYEPDFGGHEAAEMKPQVLDIATWSGKPLEEIADQAVAKMSTEPVRFQQHIREKFDLGAAGDYGEALKAKVYESMGTYREKFEGAAARFSQQAADSARLALERGYVQAEPRPYSIVPVTELLRRGLPEGFSYVHTSSYDPEHDAVVLDINNSNAVVAHEVGHALSTDFEKKQSGIMSLEQDPNKKRLVQRGAKWINEGLTVIWERMSVNDGSEEPQRGQPGDLYGWAAEAVPVLLEHLGLNQEVGLKAYFGDVDARKQLTDAVREKLHCSVEDLQCLGYECDIEWTKKVLSGEPVHVVIKPGWHETVIKTLEKLSQIFPNVTYGEK